LWSGACEAPPQQQQQQEQRCAKCVCKEGGEDGQSKFDYEGTTFGLIGLLIAEFGLGAILMVFPQARTGIYTILVWARAIRMSRPTPELAPNAVAPAEANDAPVAAPVRGN
jgi:hypothetical protein